MSSTSNTQKLIDLFYSTASYEKLEKLRNTIQNPSRPMEVRKKVYKDNSELIEKLKNIFLKLIFERNLLAKNEGFDNYFDYINDWYGISQSQINEWSESNVLLAKNIISRITEYKKVDKDYWNEFNNPVAHFLLIDRNKYKIPLAVYNYFLTQYPEFCDIQKRIILVENPNRYFYTDYNLEKKTVEIKGDISSSDSASAITFAQEVGHAIAYINLMDKNIDPESKSAYWHELQAIKKEIEYENSLPEHTINVNRDRVLYHFLLTNFEKNIYTKELDPDKAYAKAHNEIYGATQKSNPFYVLNYFLVDMPCYSTNYSVVYTKLLKNYYLG